LIDKDRHDWLLRGSAGPLEDRLKDQKQDDEERHESQGAQRGPTRYSYMGNGGTVAPESDCSRK
jgi:hypothetical protein